QQQQVDPVRVDQPHALVVAGGLHEPHLQVRSRPRAHRQPHLLPDLGPVAVQEYGVRHPAIVFGDAGGVPPRPSPPRAAGAGTVWAYPNCATSPPRRPRVASGSHNDRVTAAPGIISPVRSLNRPSMVAVGTIVWLSSELLFFAGLFAMFFSIRAAAPELWVEHNPSLNVWYALPFTLILLASSVTCQIGVFRAERGDAQSVRRWFTITFLMGLVFVLGQVYEYRNLVEEGVRLNADGFGSMYYLTTGFHALHVSGGLVAFIIYMIRSTMGRFTSAQATAAIVVSYYWHFVDVVWVALFAMIYF